MVRKYIPVVKLVQLHFKCISFSISLSPLTPFVFHSFFLSFFLFLSFLQSSITENVQILWLLQPLHPFCNVPWSLGTWVLCKYMCLNCSPQLCCKEQCHQLGVKEVGSLNIALNLPLLFQSWFHKEECLSCLLRRFYRSTFLFIFLYGSEKQCP